MVISLPPAQILSSQTTVQNWLNSKSKSKLYYDRRSVGRSLLVSSSHVRLSTRFCYYQTVASLLMWGALSDERTGLPFTIGIGPRQRSHSWVRVPWDTWPYFTLSDSRISPRNRVAQLYPQTLGSLFVAFYDRQGYGGGIRTRLHTRYRTD
jgi:hypothetical protein